MQRTLERDVERMRKRWYRDRFTQSLISWSKEESEGGGGGDGEEEVEVYYSHKLRVAGEPLLSSNS